MHCYKEAEMHYLNKSFEQLSMQLTYIQGIDMDLFLSTSHGKNRYQKVWMWVWACVCNTDISNIYSESRPHRSDLSCKLWRSEKNHETSFTKHPPLRRSQALSENIRAVINGKYLFHADEVSFLDVEFWKKLEDVIILNCALRFNI